MVVGHLLFSYFTIDRLTIMVNAVELTPDIFYFILAGFVAQMIDGALSRISSMQIPSGHFSMWGGDSYVSEILTPYVVEFLLDARDGGFAVSEDVLQKALKRLNDDLLSGGHPFYGYEHADHLRFADEAYSAYVLARVQRAPLGTLRALYDNERGKSITGLPLVHLGIALSLQGDKARGEKAVAEGFAKDVERPWYLGDYGSDLRDTSLMVALTHQFGLARPEYDAKVFDLGRNLVTQKHQQDDEEKKWRWRWNYFSTQEQGALARLGKVLIKDGQAKLEGTLSIGATMPLSPRISLRVFDQYERGRVSDWHYLGFDAGYVVGNRVYTDGGPVSYSANLIGVLLNVKL